MAELTPSGTVAIIGGTSGIGREVVTQLAPHFAHVLVVGRNEELGTAIEREIPSARFGGIDISTVAGARRAAEWITGSGRIDVLVNAAGVLPRRRQETDDGLELNFAVHHVAPFVITRGVVDALAPGGAIINVNSAGHQTPLFGRGPVRLDLDDLQYTKKWSPFLAYSRAKLAGLMASYVWARRLEGDAVVNAVHPGLVRTGIGRDFPRWQVAAVDVLAVPAAMAASRISRLAIERAAFGTGHYFDRERAVASSAPSLVEADQKRLFALTEQLVAER